jgi:hypothetical protein
MCSRVTQVVAFETQEPLRSSVWVRRIGDTAAVCLVPPLDSRYSPAVLSRPADPKPVVPKFHA